MASQVEGVKWVPGTSFIVDGFRFQHPACTAYFLTHAHSDHTTGLTQAFSAGPIFCSPITARLLRHDIGVRPDLLRVLPPDQPAVVGGVSVMPIDANHCPGAVMFLFEVPRGGAAPCHGAAVGSIHGGKARPPGPGRGGQGRSLVLHTGDMRWHGGMALHPALTGRQLDVLMLDTTYATPRWSFPPQDDAVALLVAALRREAEAGPPGGVLFVVGSYHVGKERAYLGAAHALGWRVHCSPAKHRLLRLLGLPRHWLDLVTAVPEEAQMHVLGMGEQLHPQALADRIAGTRWQRVVAVKPTGWTWRASGKLDVRVEGCVTLVGVPYSEHSSFQELRDCVRSLRPRRIIPTVNAGDAARSRAIVDRFADLMDLSADRSRLDCYLQRRTPKAEGAAAGEAARLEDTPAAAVQGATGEAAACGAGQQAMQRPADASCSSPGNSHGSTGAAQSAEREVLGASSGHHVVGSACAAQAAAPVPASGMAAELPAPVLRTARCGALPPFPAVLTAIAAEAAAPSAAAAASPPRAGAAAAAQQEEASEVVDLTVEDVEDAAATPLPSLAKNKVASGGRKRRVPPGSGGALKQGTLKRFFSAGKKG